METKVKRTNNIMTSSKKVSWYILLILLTLICLVPFYIMIINSTHTNGEIAAKLWILPGTALLDNYHRLVESVPIWKGFANSLFIAVAVTVVSGYFSALTAYGFSRYKFKGNKILYAVVLGSMMIPMQLGFIGFYQLISKMHLLNSYIPLIIPSIANASSVFFIKGYTDGAVHESLIEAARIDGSSEFSIFNKIGLPLIMPSVATMSIFTFIGTWNNYLTPLILITDMEKYTLPIMQVVAKGVYKTEFGAIYTCIAISVVPIMIAFAFLSKKIIGGLTIGGVKG
ncbi:ABC transporter permease subunit [Clostridium chromiireducens]|uniref:ABC transporter permease subunit n=1 Tax=Clostridium chromiireducens TaxID=225345 RepID=A0A964RLP9_9CLOT|nr:carbohydrate ABC transporter permease [Clostridium chromiireducens]MVX63961.1 ABC transporter permease subunit [Clostridium chromiireducens]